MNVNIYNFLKKLYYDNDQRIVGRKNIWEDMKQFVINEKLLNQEQILLEQYCTNQFPLIFIVGVPRSGTTLLMQLMAAGLDVSYISNYVSKYYMVPAFGAKRYLHRLPPLTVSSFNSNFGNTFEEHSPSEFGYFWQYWMNHNKDDELNIRELEKLNWMMMGKELKAVCGIFQKPVVFKNIVYHDYKIMHIASNFTDSLFVYIRRKPEFVIQSILESRLKRYGDIKYWWSIRPKDFCELAGQDPVDQVVYQYKYTKKKIEDSLPTINGDRIFHLDYEELVKQPQKNLKKIGNHFNLNVKSIPERKFSDSNYWRLNELKAKILRKVEDLP